MYIDSRTIDENWAAGESRKIADGLVRDVLANSRAFTRFVRFDDKALPATRNSINKSLDRSYIEKRLSLDDLQHKLTTVGDISKSNDCLLTSLNHSAFLSMADALNKEYPTRHFERSGLILYKRGNYLGWHTNSTNPVNRIYFVYSDTGESSFMSYDQQHKRIRDDVDRPGWNIREFEAGDGKEDPLFWHAVYSYCNRISIGFRVTPVVASDARNSDSRIQRIHLFDNEWSDGLDLSPLLPGKRYAVPVQALQYLLTPDRLRECSFDEIAFRPPSNESTASMQKIDTSIPGIVARNMANPQNRPYRLIDGDTRVHKMLGQGKTSAQFYVLTPREVMQHMVVQDIP
jgi:hypothetical protein